MKVKFSDTELHLISEALNCYRMIGSGHIEYLEKLYKDDGRYDGYSDIKRDIEHLRAKLLNVQGRRNLPEAPEKYQQAHQLSIKIKDAFVSESATNIE